MPKIMYGDMSYPDAGQTISIGSNGNWFIDGNDTYVKAKGSDGRALTSVYVDSNNNIVATFSDSPNQVVIGQASFNIQADFLTNNGFGNLRFNTTDGMLQYTQDGGQTWNDVAVFSNNSYIINMMPQVMKDINVVYDESIGHFKMKFEEPDDTVINGQVACVVSKVVIVRKKGSIPTGIGDGTTVKTVYRNQFGSYKDVYYIDNTFNPSNGEVWCYGIFPVSTTGFVNEDSSNCSEAILVKNFKVYGFAIEQNDSNPATRVSYNVSYTYGNSQVKVDNVAFKSAYMNYTSGSFDYGSWKDVWFLQKLKPCMLKYDGTVDYELDPNDYTKKLDGTDSDVANTAYEGNAMVGIPTIWVKCYEDNGKQYCFISDKQVDSMYKAYAHTDNNGNIMPYTYMPCYNGSNINSKLRSLSGQSCINNQSGTNEINYAKANNITLDEIWNIELVCDRLLMSNLIILLGKSTDVQTTFGRGHYTGGSAASNLLKTGTMNKDGLFYGTNGTGKGVKVFGIENFWGNQWRRIAGWINNKGVQKIKFTYGTEDGSTTTGYNTTGDGYLVIPNSTPNGTSGGYISKTKMIEYGIIPVTASGSQSTYDCDGLWFNNGQIDVALVGGACSHGFRVGLCVFLSAAVSYANWDIGASLSCKPLTNA